MRNWQLILIIAVMFSALVSGCNKDREMHQPKEKTPGELAVLEEQIDPNERGKEAIKITEDILFPGSEPYEGANYDYLANESPAKVAHWFEVNLEGCKVKKISGNKPENAKWIITLDDLIVDIVPGPDEETTLIRYKKDIHYKKQSE